MSFREFLFESLTRRLHDLEARTSSATAGTGRNYRCACGRPVFFRNSQCLACGTPLGYDPRHSWLLPLAPASDADAWKVAGREDAHRYRRCMNFMTAAVCNWLLDENDDPAQTLCIACRLNRTIPDQSFVRNQEWWRRIEIAKRRMVSSLLLLGLPVKSRLEDPQRGMQFDLLASSSPSQRVMTGHENGLITINVEEADDAQREMVREAMHEPYRTLLGHFRHEVGHYYWDLLIASTAWLEPFRALFGDERVDYAEALRRNYELGPSFDWHLRHVSTYAACHPWEDWAETWAHYLHMMDTMDTALGYGIDANEAEQAYEPFAADTLYRAEEDGGFLSFVNAWVRITGMMNELARSMGHGDLYPFVLPAAAVSKLHFVHLVVMQARGEAMLLAALPNQ